TATLLFHETITSPNKATGGIHPLLSLTSHRRHLAPLLARAIPTLLNEKPDIVAVTRGPGMVASLAVGLDTAKGLAVAWNRPLVGVNHMLAHALTPRLVSALDSGSPSVEFPFLTLLVSGGHTLLVHSLGLTSHQVLAGSIDIAIGDMVDKVARSLVPAELMEKQGETVAYGRVLEEFCFPRGEPDWAYHPPGSNERKVETAEKADAFGGDWNVAVPLSRHPIANAFSFSGLGSAVQRVIDMKPLMTVTERQALGREAMMVAFEHVSSRIIAALKTGSRVKDLVVSGGVASNKFLRHLLRRYLDAEGFTEVRLVAPPMMYCTDQAAMIAWAAAEMWRGGWCTELDVMPVRKWSLDDKVVRGGVLGVSGWVRR
ncbi:Gcp-like domain-containing protein, partial [Trichophaea hybrida]